MINYYPQRELSQTISLSLTNPHLLNLHINQILVDDFDRVIDLTVLEGITLSHCTHRCTFSPPALLSPPSLGPQFPPSSAAKLLVECIKIRDAERARLAIW